MTAPSRTGTPTVQISPAITTVSLLNGSHPVPAGATLLTATVFIEGTENPEPGNGCIFDGVVGTILADTGLTGSNTDIRIVIFGWLSPAEITAGSTSFRYEFTGAPVAVVWENWTDTTEASLAAAFNLISSSINTDPTSQTVLGGGGSGGNTLVAALGFQGNDGNPSLVDNGFSEVHEFETAATTTDFAVNIAELRAGLPAGTTTCIWATSDENTGILYELVAAIAPPTPGATPLSAMGIIVNP